MPTSRSLPSRWLAASSLLLSLGLHADEINLGADGKISGKIEEITANRDITVTSPLSPEKLQFKGESFQSIQFDDKKTSAHNTNNIIYLKNGDVIPANVEKMDDKTLSFQMPWSAKFSAPRTAIDALHFGTSENTTLYTGPNPDDWELGKTWKFDGGLVSQSWGNTHRKFDALPDRYVFSFKVAWRGNAGIKCLFASTSVDGNSATDGYFLQFNSGGLELKRQSSGSKRYTSLATFNEMTPDTMDGNEMTVELRVDRSNRLLQLAINGQQLRSNIIDPEETGRVPTGNIISFICTTGSEDRHTVSDIRITTWGSATAEARMEKRSDTKTDVLFDVESNRSSGQLKGIQPGKDLQILFENPHDPSPKPLPASKVAVIYFSGEKSDKNAPPYRIKLQGFGTLMVDAFDVTNGTLHASHPVLGALEIATDLVSEIARTP
jgi:hypothetical protein